MPLLSVLNLGTSSGTSETQGFKLKISNFDHSNISLAKRRKFKYITGHSMPDNVHIDVAQTTFTDPQYHS